MEKQLKIAVFIDFDNIEIGVKSTLQREFDVAAVLEALKERGEIVTKIAYANWGRQDTHTRALSEHAVQMVQRDPSPRGDKNGADINLALDALEMAFTHDHINAFAIVSGDSDFIALVNKLKQYDKTVFVVGGRAFTSTILQKNCHEFVSYESLMDEQPRQAPSGGSSAQQQLPLQAAPASGEKPAFVPREYRQHHEKSHGGGGYQQRSGGGGGGQQRGRPPALDLGQAMPLVERALQVLERREVRPQLGLLKSTMLQLDSSFSERAYGASSFTDFVEKLRKADYVAVTGGEGRYMIQRKNSVAAEKTVKPENALPVLRDVLENHRLEMEDGALAEDLAVWVKEEQPSFDWKQFGFQEFSEMLNFAQDKGVVRVQPDEEKGLLVHLGAEFHPPAIPEPAAPILPMDDEPEEEGPQPVVKGQPTAREPRVKRSTRKTASSAPTPAADEHPEPEPAEAADGEPKEEETRQPEPKKATRKMPTKRAGTRRIKSAPKAEPPAAEAEPEPAEAPAPPEGGPEE